MRLQITLVYLLLTSFVYGQKSTLFQNKNSRALELKHELNKTNDSLILKCDRTIFEVVFFNDDFERVVRVRKKEAKIAITDLPVGQYIIETLLRDKLIVLTLVRNEEFKLPKQDIIANVVKQEEKKPTPSQLLNRETITKKSDLAVAGKKAVRTVEVKRKQSTALYWIEYKINTGQNTLKTEKFGDQATIDQMIRKIEIDKKTKTGRLNELIVWKVFDSSKFLKHRRANKNNYSTTASDSYNTEPYYKEVNELDSK
ncbi:hypothetical protein [uncultured Winogradskyella sp.]|uniref:hypothetical protein n=1 Tax=uncultured Winogradskyella sp. TaxID=395353 RepID=UPI00260D9C85|nr:hypothetical protein [uncultured Winogradskyella sp.]